MIKQLILFTQSFLNLSDTLDYNNCSVKDGYLKKKIVVEELSRHENIDLRCNGIKDISDFKLNNVRYLNLSSNPLKVIRNSFKNLVSVDVSNTRLTDFPSDFCEAENLRIFNGRTVFFLKFPQCLCENNRLEILNIELTLGPLPKNLISCTRLRNFSAVLDEDSTQSRKDLEVISGMKNITHLGLYNLNVSEIRLKNKDNIKSLRLSLTNDSFFDGIVKELSNWRGLKNLEIVIDSETVSESIYLLKNIETLIIRRFKSDQRVTFPTNLGELKSLKAIFEFKNFKSLKLDKKISVMRTSFNRDAYYNRAGYSLVDYRNIVYIENK